MSGPPFDKAWEILDDLLPRLREEMHRGHDEHKDSWRSEEYEQMAALWCGSYPKMIGFDITRKLLAYLETGDPQQILGLLVYACFLWGWHRNKENENA